jgi:lipopolysaccharide transport system ATP-binding protein
VASLLEVGTGFHGELSGRENVYLNGAVLGMSRAEIRGKFDEIVAFAEVDRFLDTPIKRYSNGMAVRLAFAIAAHVEPDILVVDEVLAVGDAAFQRKCLSKMETVSAKEGRTILFVSHQMGLVTQLCSRGILLEGGRLVLDASASEAAQAYLALDARRVGYEHDAQRSVGKEMFFTRVRLLDPSGRPTNTLGFEQPLDIEIEAEVVHPSEAAQLAVILMHQTLGRVFTEIRDVRDLLDGSGRFRCRLVVPPHIIAPGHYALRVSLFIHNQRYFDNQEGVCPFQIHDTGSRMAMYEGQDYGTVIPPCEWRDAHVE